MFDWASKIGASSNFTLDAEAAATVLSIVTFLVIFAAALANRHFRHQSLGVFVGLTAVFLFAALFLLGTIGYALLGLPWVQKLFSGEMFFYFFCVVSSAFWLAALLASDRYLEPNRARRVYFKWQLAVWGLSAAILSCGAIEGYDLFHFPLNEAARQILAGTAAGIFVTAAVFALHHLWRKKAALWFWLSLASLIFAGSISLFYFTPHLPLLGYTGFGIAALLVIAGLFADHARFLRLESELRSGMLENALKLEGELQRQAAILEFTSEAVVHLDRDERVRYANAHFLQLAAREASGKVALVEIEGKKLSALLSQNFYDQLRPSLQEVRHGRSSLREIRHFSADRERLLQVFSAPLRDRQDKIIGAHFGLLDFTSRRLAELSIEETLAQKVSDLRFFQQCTENASDGIVITDADNKILYANEAFERLTGYTRGEMIGREPQVYRNELDPSVTAEINRRLTQRKAWRGELSCRRKDGSTFMSDLSVVPVEDPEKKIVRHLWIERDVTARKELEHQLQSQTEALAAKSAEIATAKQNYESLQARANELQRRIDQLAKLMEIGEDIRLNASLELIMQSVSEAVAALGWQRVLVYHRRDNDMFEMVASSGLANQGPAANSLRQMPYTEFAPYLLERFRMSQSFCIDADQLTGKSADFPLSNNLKKAGIFDSNHSKASKKGNRLANAMLFVPIRAREQLLGLIAVFGATDERHPDLQRVRDLEIFADDAAIAIENSRLLALHQHNERQARVLADMGNVFQAAGTVEQVVTDIAGIGAQAVGQPCLIVVRPAGEEGWLGAFSAGSAARNKIDRAKNSLLNASELPANFLARVAGIEIDVAAVELSHEELPRSVWDAVSKNAAKGKLVAQMIALRSRGQKIGCMSYLLPSNSEISSWKEEDKKFATVIAERAALIIENARLFHATEEKAFALERANQLISEFLASVSHELRTPMHSILQYSEILLSQGPGKLNNEQKHQLEVIRRSGKSLLALLNDILDLSKIEAGKMEATIEKFNPAQMIREAVDAIRPLCAQKHLALRLRLDEGFPAAFCSDRSMLLRVLTNLLGNAVKFTERGEIEVWARRRSAALVVSVRDTGAGIPAARQKDIFEPFRQLETSEARQHSGTGLGLAISKKMLAILGGEIELESQPGKGSTFTIRVPESDMPSESITARRRDGKARAPSEQKKKKKAANAFTSKRTSRITSLLTAPLRNAGRDGKRSPFNLLSRERNRDKTPRILVVEDDENTRYAMQFILENAGYQVDFAEGGEKALLAAQHHRPDLILMDIMMPNMDGYQVARMLKAQKQLAHIPVVALTARAMKGDREKAIAAGCNDYLTKPFESKDILGMLEKWLGK